MGADYSFYVKFIATRAPTFFGYIISVLASVGIYLNLPTENHLRNHIANYGKSAVNTLVIGRYLALLSSKISLPTNRVPKEILVASSMPSTSIGKYRVIHVRGHSITTWTR